MEFTPHEIIWTDEKVKRFWDFYNNNQHLEGLWFSKAVGKGVIKFIERHISLKGKLLDYGTGKGHFVSYLLAKPDIEVYSCDFSEETVNNNNAQFAKHPNYKGCTLVQGFPSGFEDGSFDVVFLIEAIEHLTEKYLRPTIAEAFRLIKTGGKIVITTPNNENLDQQKVQCPDCGCLFHRVQHVNRFDSTSLSSLMSEHKFSTIFSGATDFFQYNPKGFLYAGRNQIKKILKPSYEPPHLVYIGEKK
jgi:2-polyprenyl-3-methyl-5-hydroxy-6-metoxy-1,4-benzoquinol methylase